MGLGYALCEDFLVRDGMPCSTGFKDYHLLRAHEVPQIVPILIEDPEPTGPFGAKGVGEPPTVAVAPAIANAVFDAIGVRITELPLTPAKILRALSPHP